MSESTAPETGGKQQDYTPPATQEDFNRIIGERVKRAQDRFADYDDLKAKAAQFDALEESKKTDEQKHQERISALESELATSKFQAEKSRIQAKHGISDADADLFLTSTDPEQLEAQAKALAERAPDRKPRLPFAPEQRGGEKETPPLDPMRQLARQVFDT